MLKGQEVIEAQHELVRHFVSIVEPTLWWDIGDLLRETFDKMPANLGCYTLSVRFFLYDKDEAFPFYGTRWAEIGTDIVVDPGNLAPEQRRNYGVSVSNDCTSPFDPRIAMGEKRPGQSYETGYIRHRPCSRCRGAGYLEESPVIDLNDSDKEMTGMHDRLFELLYRAHMSALLPKAVAGVLSVIESAGFTRGEIRFTPQFAESHGRGFRTRWIGRLCSVWASIEGTEKFLRFEPDPRKGGRLEAERSLQTPCPKCEGWALESY